jgi:membrane-bound lytic murein transglycosylase D
MLLRYSCLLSLIILSLVGCARTNYNQSSLSSGITLYGVPNGKEAEIPLGMDSLGRKYALPPESENLFAKQKDSRFFLLEANSQTWRAYYYFFYLRDEIFENYPEYDPKRKQLPVVLNSRVQYYMGYFQTSGRKFFEKWLQRSGKYIPMMSEILQKKGLPPDLVYLAMIESGFNVKAKSHAAAVGPWQFIRPTALRYGLRVDSWVDERMDPEKSTIAAANYLGDLYEMFQSWELAAAGYNCGEQRVQAAIDTYNLYDYWAISDLALPKETRDYVPKLMAALIIAKDPQNYGFTGIYYSEPLRYENVSVPPQKSLNDIARIIGASSNTLVELNPNLRYGVTPPGGSYEIKVPPGYGRVVASRQLEIASLKTIASVGYSGSGNSLRYRVRRGDSLGRISNRYNVSVSSIKKANRLKGSTIRIGQVLTIPGRGSTSGRNYGYASNDRVRVKYRVNGGDTLGAIAARHQVSISTIKRANNIKGSAIFVGQVLSIPNAVPPKYVARSGTPGKYRVSRGDTLGKIAQRHGVSVSAIKSANNINGSTIMAGQTIRIPGTKGSRAGSTSTSKATVKYKVKRGDTIGLIAKRHGVSVSSITGANNIRGSKILVGQTLTIPGSSGGGYSSSAGTKPSKYKVKSGDTLGTIAARNGVSVASIKSTNGLKGSTIRVGQTLTIRGGSGGSYSGSAPRTSVKYRVKSGDTLGTIAARNGVSVASIKSANGLKGSTIVVGQTLNIPNGEIVAKNSTSSRRGSISHRVRRGETLWKIASQYDVSVSDLKRWNNLKTSRLVAGERLSINVD